MDSIKQQKMDDLEIKTLFFQACAEGDILGVDRLMAMSSGLLTATDDCGLSPLCVAALDGQTAMVKWLIEKGADVGFQVEGNSWTPILYGAISNSRETVDMLVHFGADLSHITPRGMSAYTIAIMRGNDEFADYLCEKREVQERHRVQNVAGFFEGIRGSLAVNSGKMTLINIHNKNNRQ